MPQKVVIAWSGGKDASLALHELRQDQQYEVAALLTTLTEGYERISMHGVRRSLLLAQAAAIGVPLREVWIPQKASNEQYQEAMRKALDALETEGVRTSAFGDIFLEDVRAYREHMLAQANWQALFPLWKRDTALMAQEFLRLGFKAILVCVDTRTLDASFAGRLYDDALLADLPASVDPCGENGEFHTFVYDGPIFSQQVPFTKGEVVLREKRWAYCDLLPCDSPR